jgi:diguanylate cyclase (GGDEF)-like protein
MDMAAFKHLVDAFDRGILHLRAALARVEVLALFPLVTLIALWFDLGDVVFLCAVLLPALLALQAFGPPSHNAGGIGGLPGIDRLTGTVPGQDALLAMLERIGGLQNRDTACILIQIDDWDGFVDRWGGDAAEDIAERCLERLTTTLRQGDMVARLSGARFGIVLQAMPSARLATRDAIVSRLRASIGEPLAIGGCATRLGCCIGHSNLMRNAADPAAATFAAAETALGEAHRTGPGAVRAFAPALIRLRTSRNILAQEVEGALAGGEIRAWFQPQIRTETNAISGFEALARWHHPDRGVLTPPEFLQAIEDAGRMDDLGQAILFQSLNALQSWDKAGLPVPSVSVNVSAGELRNPAFVDRILWDLDRFDLRPARLTVEILETVAAKSDDDAVTATLAALGAQGIRLDLDDFGVGQASLSAIRRFGVSRIKIDRSFILGLDRDPEQQSMVSAILAMAVHLGVETLAEGVETQSVQALLTELGCTHVQGFHLARPMPFDDTVPWVTQHCASQDPTGVIGRRAG